MNYMAKVAEMFGVEIGEEFEVRGNTFHLDYRGLMSDRANKDYAVTLSDLLRGNSEITHKPWQPKLNENYFSIIWGEPEHVLRFQWRDDHIDKRYMLSNLCFRTKEEAITAAQKMLKALEE